MNEKKGGRKLHAGALCAVLVLAISSMSSAVSDLDHEIDPNELFADTQRNSLDPDRLTMVWWLPEEFWTWSFAQDDTISEEGVEQFLAVLRPYVLLVVLEGTVGPLGGANFSDLEELRERVALVDAKGGRHTPLGDDGITADARNLASMMKPILANMLGPTGENMGFFFFPSTTGDGEAIASATTEGTFSVEVGDELFEWKTPLGSVLPPKVCPVDDEEMSGAWSYCPWHGKKLVAKKPNR